eukprot:352743-Chlamydomonas_euryale.AAC.26
MAQGFVAHTRIHKHTNPCAPIPRACTALACPSLTRHTQQRCPPLTVLRATVSAPRNRQRYPLPQRSPPAVAPPDLALPRTCTVTVTGTSSVAVASMLKRCSPAHLQALMRRLEARLVSCGAPLVSVWSQLRRLYPKSVAHAEADAGHCPSRRPSSMASLGSSAHASGAATPARLPDRYPVRVLLTAWMVVRYPEVRWRFHAIGRSRGERGG